MTGQDVLVAAAVVVAVILTVGAVVWTRRRRSDNRMGLWPAASEALYSSITRLKHRLTRMSRRAAVARQAQTSAATLSAAVEELSVVEHRPAWLNTAAILLIGGIVVVLMGQALWQGLPLETRATSRWFTPAGLLLVALGARTFQAGGLPHWLDRPLAWVGRKLNLQAGQVLCLAMSGLFGALASLASGAGEKMPSPTVALIGYGLSLLLAAVGSWGAMPERSRLPWRALGLTALLVLVAFAVRGINTGHIPRLLTGDEGSSGLSAVRFSTGEVDNIFGVSWYSWPSFYSYLTSLSIRVLGRTTEALRLPSALVGALTVGALYLICAKMFDKRTALLASLVLTTMHIHVHFSRLGLNNIWDGLGFVVTAGALWHGWHTGRRAAFLLAGLGLGFSQYFYASGRLLIALVASWLLVASLLDRHRLKSRLVDIGLMFFVALITVLPLAVFYIHRPDDFLAPLVRFSVLGDLQKFALARNQTTWQFLLDQFKVALKAYTHEPSLVWYSPGVPILRAVPAGIFLIGLVLLAMRPKDLRLWMIGLWLLAFVFSGALSDSTPAAQRYVDAAPACAMVIGYALSEVAALVTRVFPKRATVLGALSVVVALALTIDDARFYFLEYTPDSDFGGDNSLVAESLGYYLKSKSSDWQVVFFGWPRMGFHSLESLQYLAPHISGIDVNQPWGSPENPQPSSERLIFVFLPGHEEDLRNVEASYPGGRLTPVSTQYGTELYSLYEIPPGP